MDLRKTTRSNYRRLTSCFRKLPDFIVIGAQKAGTTSLFRYLSQHPRIAPSFKKEVHFFDGGLDPAEDSFKKGVGWYRSHFPLDGLKARSHVTGEASPLYLYHPLSASRVAHVVPGAKLIALLRNPTERAISNYYHMKRRGRECLPLMEALQSEEQRIGTATGSNEFNSYNFLMYSYKRKGIYKAQLDRYFGLFPQSQIMIIKSEELFSRPEEVTREVFRFIGVEDNVAIPDMDAANVGNTCGGADEAVVRYLDDYFRPHNRALCELLGRPFDW